MMQYEKFVVAVKAGEKFLRDQDGVVRLPFGTDYNLFLKNINSRDAVVSVSIDGEDVLGGSRLVVNANSKMELLGFLEGQSVKNKFRFIELTKEVEDRVGYSPLDSLIRLEIRYRKPKPIVQEITTTYTYPKWEYYPWTYTSRGTGTYSTSAYTSSADMPVVAMASCACNFTSNEPCSDVGVTVKGQQCNQEFSSIFIDDLEEQSHVMVIRLSGYRENNNKVETLIGSQEKIECPTCGRKNENKSKYCSNCGTFLR